MERKSDKIRSYLKVIWVPVLFLLMACGGSQSPAEVQREYEELVQLVTSRDFEIRNQWANPMQGNNVSLIGNYNFIRFKGDSVEIQLPYFGVRHSGGGYGSSGGVEFTGLPEEFRMERNPEEKEVYVRFEGNQDSEDLQFLITLFPNGKTTTSVNSSQRSNISYRGEIQ